MKINYFKNIFNLIFPIEQLPKQKVQTLIENRIFYSPHNQSIVFLPYSHTDVKTMMWQMKFKKDLRISTFFGEILYENLPDFLANLAIAENFHNPLLVTIPISWRRKLARGYDQNTSIIASFFKLGGSEFIAWEKGNLKKSRNTQPQSAMKNKKERQLNVQGSLSLQDPQNIRGRNILLFDDILTTGATVNEAKKVLKQAGAKKIIVCALAH